MNTLEGTQTKAPGEAARPQHKTPIDDVRLVFSAVHESLNQTLAGHDKLIERLLVAVITGGHVLIEGSPGLAKTRAVNSFSSLINADFVRIQATPDLLPADLTGTNVYQQQSGTFNFIRGPLFNNVCLLYTSDAADE